MKISFKQITTGSYESDFVIYGLTEEGKVYFFSETDFVWKPIEMEAWAPINEESI